MMKHSERKIKVVIGASYGDEGKGLMTDHFCKEAFRSGSGCLTVLHNGGAQRGHTVSLENGVRHVFHHLSSGTFSCSDTYFTDTFIVNPMVFAEEHSELLPDTKICCSPRCRWSTPFDMMINQIAEDSRGKDRHGSCGFGIWETIVRYSDKGAVGFPRFIAMSRTEKNEYLKSIRDNYLPRRLCSLGVKSIPEKWRETIFNNNIIDNFIADCEYFGSNTHFCDDEILEGYPYIVFEGAQGLLLNQDLGENEKYTTPSLTGGDNPARIIAKLSGNNAAEICYVTRSYLTRHGAGPLDSECRMEEIAPFMRDLTNVPNEYQGALRYGRLNVKELLERINEDHMKFSFLPGTIRSLAVTHLNETGGKIITTTGDIIPQDVGVKNLYCSYDEYGAKAL